MTRTSESRPHGLHTVGGGERGAHDGYLWIGGQQSFDALKDHFVVVHHDHANQRDRRRGWGNIGARWRRGDWLTKHLLTDLLVKYPRCLEVSA